MSDLSEIRRAIAQLPAELQASMRERVASGLDALRKPEAIPLEVWAHRHFYLSAESSQREEQWRAWPIQIGMLHCMGDDNVEELWVYKSARLGYTKCLLADIGYTAAHQRRNQGLWLPKDGDRDDFVKTDLDPMLRDVAAMRNVFPKSLARSKDNTLLQKKFLGSILKLRGGQAAGNYRRLTLAKARADEIDGFDHNIEGAGTPDALIKKRVEGATYPKFIAGSTGRRKGLSHIERGHDACDVQMKFHITCPNPACGVEHPLMWGGPEVKYGIKWDMEDPEGTARHLCPHCHHAITQADYLGLARTGCWISKDGDFRLMHWWDDKGEPHARWTTADGTPCLPPKRVGMHCWTAYSEQPGVTWGKIVREFLDALKAFKEGNRTPMIQWVNETKGETYEDDGDKADVNALQTRAKSSTYTIRRVPWGCLVLAAGVDVQDDRFEVTVWGRGPSEGEMFAIDYFVMDANPALMSEWDRLWQALQLQYKHLSGAWLGLSGAAVDTGGHFTHQAYAFVAKYNQVEPSFRLYAIKGSSKEGDPIKARSAKWVDINMHGRVVKRGVKLWLVGTDTAKDLFYGYLKVTQPGPGFVHFPRDMSAEWFRQFGNEKRMPFTIQGAVYFRWVHLRGANEAIDTTVYAMFVFEALNVSKYDDRKWAELQAIIAAPDLFGGGDPEGAPPAMADAAAAAESAATESIEVAPRPKPQEAATKPAQRKPTAPPPSDFGSSAWRSRL